MSEHRSKRKIIGKRLAWIVILILLLNEAASFYIEENLPTKDMTFLYFRWVLLIPVLIFFYFGRTWAVWLVRIGLSLGILGALILIGILYSQPETIPLVPVGVLSLIINGLGTWIVFGSESFRSFLRSRKRARRF
ncbi:hypothetical protein [Puniceicoccus vermicola]|uniref:Uncharacterized protein n=1 Tax=Puniceicoccus vermicola TaxID=388746 RepID=A0A7X1E4U3_9BACT|nr:hypothetical protein [Puniceicoccus vermicola]MBC2600967.1 hypothetical protein [Puniceicoccus vermicola]